MIDYAEAKAYADFWRSTIMPHVKTELRHPCSFADYLGAFYRYPNLPTSFAMNVPYIYTLEWLPRYHKKCVHFQHNTPDDVNKGGSLLAAIYQISPRLHVLGSISIWRDEGKSDGHVHTFMVYEDLSEALRFVDSNNDIVKEPVVVTRGFALQA